MVQIYTFLSNITTINRFFYEKLALLAQKARSWGIKSGLGEKLAVR